MPDIPRSETISTRQQTIAKLAQQAPELSFTSLNHHMDMAWVHEAYRRTRKDGAPGVDEQTAAAYAEHLDDNLRDLLDCRSPRALVQVITRARGKRRQSGQRRSPTRRSPQLGHS